MASPADDAAGRPRSPLRGLSGAAPLLILVLFAAESLRGAAGDAQTSDESVYIASGYAWLKTGRIRANPEHPMLAKALIAAPLLVLRPELDLDTDAWRAQDQYLAAYEFLWENRVPGQRLVFAARLPVIAASLLLLGLIYLGGRRLYGPAGGLLALLAAATCPDLLGHGHLATLDVPLALVATLALAFLLSYAARPSRGRHAGLALMLGLALATKVSAVQLLPALFAAAVLRALVDPELAGRGRVRVPRWIGPPWLRSLYVLGGGLLTASLYGGVILWLSYLCSWRRLVGAFFGAGLTRNAMLAGYGHPAYLLGDVSLHGFKHYFLVAAAVKLPLLTLVLLATAAATWRRRNPDRRAASGTSTESGASRPTALGRFAPSADPATFRIEATAVGFALTFLVLASLGPAQTGIRYLLPVYPVLFVFLARVVRLRAGVRPGLRLGLSAVVAAAYVAVVVAARPFYLSYFNELVGGARRGMLVLADSNLDWGQDLGRLGRWLAERGNPPVRLAYFGNPPPEAYGVSYQALPAGGPLLAPPELLIGAGAPDLLAISANNLLGLLFVDHDLYAWLQQREPVAELGSIFVYDLGGRSEDHRRLADLYRRFGWQRWAAHELELAR